MHIKILTLFPELFSQFLNTSIIKNTINKGIVQVSLINFRDYSKQKNKKVDAKQIGGGGGMVLQLQPLVECIEKNKVNETKVILLSPQGKLWNQKEAIKYSREKDIMLICGRYEGFDERINEYVDEIYSIGDYVLTGGEIPSMVIMESVTRLIDNAINKQSLDCETFDENLLDYPVYAKPLDFRGKKVPEILLSGDHKKIERWRKEQRIIKTKKCREDLLKK
ncbi:MAG: tRNA (guanosine(37)-N1)-methyltransferase TrmD [Mycoplasmataceae bacterium]|nr:tRNA (guanosine(37)-N1)-methyltransferase TrmD [Mycoplasmataceae bacterium]